MKPKHTTATQVQQQLNSKDQKTYSFGETEGYNEFVLVPDVDYLKVATYCPDTKRKHTCVKHRGAAKEVLSCSLFLNLQSTGGPSLSSSNERANTLPYWVKSFQVGQNGYGVYIYFSHVASC